MCIGVVWRLSFECMTKSAGQIQRLLLTNGSFTKELEALACTKISVQVVFSGLRLLSFDEKKHLGLPLKPTLGYVRETILGAHGQAWVHAISVMPLDSLQGDAKRLRHLKNTPIGYVLFKKQTSLPYDRFVDTHHGIRQNVYDWHGRKFLIRERVLTDLMDYFDASAKHIKGAPQ